MSRALNLPGARLFRGAPAAEADGQPASAPATEGQPAASAEAGAHMQTHVAEAAAIAQVVAEEANDFEVIPLVARLCEELRAAGVRYCHWKSNWRLGRWLRGEGDLDLLVEREDAGRFGEVVARLGFKLALPTPDRQLPGVLDYYGFDAEAVRLVHLHVHQRLVLGNDLTKNFHLPIERPYLEASVERGPVRVPSAEFELIIFVFRMVLKHAPGEAALRKLLRRGSNSAVRKELDFLEARASRETVRELLRQHLPFIEADFFDECLRSLREGRRRFRARLRLESRLRAHARRAQSADVLVKSWRRVSRTARERVLKQSSRKRPAGGGSVIALVGGDGAGKTTSADVLHKWLSKKFVVRRFHLGKPPRSPFTLAALVALKARSAVTGHREAETWAPHLVGRDDARPFPGYVRLFRWVCAARDRHRLYVRMRRFADAGGIAICDRYPVRQLQLMDGPNIARAVEPARMNRLVRLMLRAETSYYARIMPPDMLFVLRVEPETAVRRKTSENATHVRTRSRELWEQDWRGTRAHVIDAGRPAAEVVARLQSIVWAEL